MCKFRHCHVGFIDFFGVAVQTPNTDADTGAEELKQTSMQTPTCQKACGMYNQNDSERRSRGGDVLDGNVMRGPEKHDKKVDGE